jgi:serine protease inhibitor
MSTRLFAHVPLLLVATCAVCAHGATATSRSDAISVVTGNNEFALNMYARLALQNNENVVFSPHSISTALAMTYAGARGQTEAQMGEVLRFTIPQRQLHVAMGTMITHLDGESREGYELAVANRLWGQQGHKFLPGFLRTTRRHYGSKLGLVDFVKDTEEARRTINAWVETQTRDTIEELIGKGVVGPQTRLVLTNAIYFKGDWASRFDEKLTCDAPFTVASDNRIDVPMMQQEGGWPCSTARGNHSVPLLTC